MGGKPFPVVLTEHPAQWHIEHFIEFTELKQAVGEPSPHMTLAGYLTHGITDSDERYWRAGVYGAPYSVLTSEAIWDAWPWWRAKTDPKGLEAWVREHWEGFHIRTERRMVRTPDKMVANLLSYRDWMLRGTPAVLAAINEVGSPREVYDAAYNSIVGHPPNGVMYFGRYITIRVVEFLRRYAGLTRAELYDIRSIGGESPVRCLSLLYPQYERQLLVDKDPVIADACANELLESVRMSLPEVGHYVLAAMLCEYREAYEDRHQYPARTIDQELDYMTGPKGQYWSDLGHKTRLWEARKEAIPWEALGEVTGGWSGIRHDLSRYLRDEGKNWSDTRYKYPGGDDR